MIVAPALLAHGLAADHAPVEAASRLGWTANAVLELRYQLTDVTVQPALTTMVQSEYPDPSVAASALNSIRDTARAQDGLRLGRILLDLEARVARTLSARLELDFAPLLYGQQGHSHGGAEPLGLVEEAHGEYAPIDEFALEAGLVHVPFSLFELSHEPDFEFAEMGPNHELLTHLRYAGGEVGVMFELNPLPTAEWLGLSLGAYDSGAIGAQKHPGPGLIAGRIESEPIHELRLGAGAAWRPRAVETWWEEYRFSYQAHDEGLAYGADIELSLDPVGFIVEGLGGDRTDNDVLTPLLLRRGDARTFMGAWAMATLEMDIRGITVVPAVRAEWLDTDREHDDVGELIQLSAALNLDLSEHWRLLCEVSQRYVQPGTKNWNFNLVRYDTDAAAAIAQVQLRL